MDKVLLLASVLGLGLGGAVAASAQPTGVALAGPGRFGNWGSRPTFSALEFQSLLQRFVNAQYRKSFRRLGIEEDFDHGHLLFDARSPQRPVAILYHTQELSSDASMDPRARNWIQWVDRGTIEDASRYERKTYPHSASWDWFVARELAALRRRYTILDKMLDPALLGVEVAQSQQWVFTRVGCGGASAPAPGSDLLQVVLPSGPPVCLSLSKS
jgi:hypothetical protein